MKVCYCPIQISLILSQFQTEGTRTNFEGFAWDAIKLWFLISYYCNSELNNYFGMRASFRILYKNMTSYAIISKKIFFWRHQFRTLYQSHILQPPSSLWTGSLIKGQRESRKKKEEKTTRMGETLTPSHSHTGTSLSTSPLSTFPATVRPL